MSNKIQTLNLVIIGDHGVGKNALADPTGAYYYDPTYGEAQSAKVEVNGSPCMLEISMFSGGEQYSAMGDLLICSGDAFILAYSVTSRTSFSHVQACYNQIKVIKEEANRTPHLHHPLSPYNWPVILVGTKIDLEAQREVSAEEGQILANTLGCPFIETSVRRKINVEKMLYDVVRCFRQQNHHRSLEALTTPPSSKGQEGVRVPRRRKYVNDIRCVVM